MEKLLEYNSVDSIYEVILMLKQSYGEGWAVGDFVERELEKHLLKNKIEMNSEVS